MHTVIVIGGGPAGLMAAISASKLNKNVILLEKNEKLGKKLYITGKGRCNLSNDVDVNEFLENVVSNKKFLFGAMHSFSSSDTINFFENNGMPIKIERGKRIFPASDKASDVTKTLEKICLKNGVDIRLNQKVKSIKVDNSTVIGVYLENGDYISANSIILATGGVSYPLTGSDGEGHKISKKLGHSITELKPALVGIELNENFYKAVQGLALKNVKLIANYNGKKIFDELGETLFTHFGISGPLVLSVSSLINRLDLKNLDFYLDLKPALDYNTLDQKFIKEFSENSLKTVSVYLKSVLPHSLVDEVIFRAKINKEKKLSNLTTVDRDNLIKTLKRFELSIAKLRPIEEAIVTSGGINVKEINPKTMESKLISGLFFAGEIIDIDAFTGGFNIQIAFSTGHLAGLNA